MNCGTMECRSLVILMCLTFSLRETTGQILVEVKNQTTKTATTAPSEDYDYGCSDGEFDCGGGECILQTHVCDRTEDCSDGVDEDDCEYVSQGCFEDEFDCGDNTCILKTKLCDNFLHCHNGLDERNCEPKSPVNQSTTITTTAETTTTEEYDYAIDCPEHQFPCSEGICVPNSLVCNGKNDCDDGGDELECDEPPTKASTESMRTTRQTTSSSRTCRFDQFQCSNGQCISKNKRCDGKIECTDYSDERHCPVVGSTMISKMMTRIVRRTTASTPTKSCRYRGEWYPAGDDIVPGNCSGILCTSAGKVLSWTDPTCAACLSTKVNSVVLFLLAVVCALANWR